MFRVYSPRATEPWPSVSFSIASSKSTSQPGFTLALTRYRITLLLHVSCSKYPWPWLCSARLWLSFGRTEGHPELIGSSHRPLTPSYIVNQYRAGLERMLGG